LKTSERDERSTGSNPVPSAKFLIMEFICEYCGKIMNKKQKFCSPDCSSKKQHEEAYKDFLENNEKYCRGNYTPKNFKTDFLIEQKNLCAICGCTPEHNGKPLVFVLDHIDGDASNNKRENLRMICPNCDSQLDTFKSKNKNSTRRNYWKEHIIKQTNK
jgi:RNA polymerase subunit RPABC4/transcription elongation factor Spt4